MSKKFPGIPEDSSYNLDYRLWQIKELLAQGVIDVVFILLQMVSWSELVVTCTPQEWEDFLNEYFDFPIPPVTVIQELNMTKLLQIDEAGKVIIPEDTADAINFMFLSLLSN